MSHGGHAGRGRSTPGVRYPEWLLLLGGMSSGMLAVQLTGALVPEARLMYLTTYLPELPDLAVSAVKRYRTAVPEPEPSVSWAGGPLSLTGLGGRFPLDSHPTSPSGREP